MEPGQVEELGARLLGRHLVSKLYKHYHVVCMQNKDLADELCATKRRLVCPRTHNEQRCVSCMHSSNRLVCRSLIVLPI